MRVLCKTNLDLFCEIWPVELPSIPNVGDEIESARKWQNDFRLSLRVCAVRWEYCESIREWIPVIELHMTNWQKKLPCSLGEQSQGSIRAFYEWYAPKVGKTLGNFI